MKDQGIGPKALASGECKNQDGILKAPPSFILLPGLAQPGPVATKSGWLTKWMNGPIKDTTKFIHIGKFIFSIRDSTFRQTSQREEHLILPGPAGKKN